MSNNHIGTTKSWSPYFNDWVRLGVETELYLVYKQQEMFMSKYIAQTQGLDVCFLSWEERREWFSLPHENY